MRFLTLSYFVLLFAISHAPAAFVTPKIGGGQVGHELAPMKHVDISFANDIISIHVDHTVGTPRLRPLEAPDEFDPAQPWGVLGTKAYNFQYGWNPSGFISLPSDAWIWIEQLSATPGLDVYQRPPASPAYAPIFGTDGSAVRWRWGGSMTHNVYAVQDPSLFLYEATYRVYIGDDTTGEPMPAYSPADITFQFAATPVLHADFDNDGDVDGQDLLQWEADFALNSDSDADGDGDSDGADFLVWQRELGSYSDPEFATLAVPEPSTASLLLGAVGCTLYLLRFSRLLHKCRS